MKRPSGLKFKNNLGFTIIELIIAITIIGILAVIVSVSYSGITDRATESTIKSDLSNALGEINLFRTEKNKYPTAIDDCPNIDTNKICIEFSEDNQYEYLVDSATNPTSYRLIVTNKDLAYYIEDDFNSPKLLDASVPEFNPIPTAPTTYTLTLTAGTGGTVSGAGTFDTGTVRTITATPSSYYSFSSWTGSTGCSGTASHTITMDANKSCTANFTPTAIAVPSAPTVSASTVGATTTWSWGATSCPGNTARYQYRYTISPSGYDSGLVATANTSVAFTTSTEGQTYAVSVQAQCYNPITSSSWSTAGSASYYRPLTGGTVTFNSGSGSWIAPAGVTSVTAYVWGAGGSGTSACDNQGGGGGGAFATKAISVTSGNSYNYSVGAAVFGAAGGDSWFINSSTVLAKGGMGSPPDGSGGLGGQASASIPTTGAYSGGNGGSPDHDNEYGGGGGGGAGSGGNGGVGGNASGNYGPGGVGGSGIYSGGNGGGGFANAPGSSPGGGGLGTDSYDCGTGGLGGSGKIILVW